jgi:methionyl-tRNA formyltransferase
VHLDDVGMVAANTTRSRVYLQALVQTELVPSFVLVMEEGAKTLPGQSVLDKQKESSKPRSSEEVELFKLMFSPGESLKRTLQNSAIPFNEVHTTDINSKEMLDALLSRPESVFIYSGYGGSILRKTVLGIGKRFLHVHGGYLPDYKGSTTNYYSMISDNECGASSLFLNEKIDCGPVLLHRKFPAPDDRLQLDYVYDSMIRAKVLVETMESYVGRKRKWEFEMGNNTGGETYYIIHPVLRHIAILAE